MPSVPWAQRHQERIEAHPPRSLRLVAQLQQLAEDLAVPTSRLVVACILVALDHRKELAAALDRIPRPTTGVRRDRRSTKG